MNNQFHKAIRILERNPEFNKTEAELHDTQLLLNDARTKKCGNCILWKSVECPQFALSQSKDSTGCSNFTKYEYLTDMEEKYLNTLWKLAAKVGTMIEDQMRKVSEK